MPLARQYTLKSGVSLSEVRHICEMYGIPTYMINGLHLYYNYGVQTGAFLQAVLEGDFREAARLADEKNYRAITDSGWQLMLQNEAEPSTWGSVERRAEFMASFKRDQTQRVHWTETFKAPEPGT